MKVFYKHLKTMQSVWLNTLYPNIFYAGHCMMS